MELKIIYEDDTLVVVDKPPGVAIEQLPRLGPLGKEWRKGIVHRLDKDTSGVLLVAKTKESFEFFQKQFKERRVEKKYLCLVTGVVKHDKGMIETLLGRAPGDKRKQKVYLVGEPGSEGKREAATAYRVLERFKEYTFLEAIPKTGRKHQIRAHLTYLGHPIAGDKLYGFKNQAAPEGLNRQFLHASYLRVAMPDDSAKEFSSELPEDLKQVRAKLKP